jgi:hypothetical protein
VAYVLVDLTDGAADGHRTRVRFRSERAFEVGTDRNDDVLLMADATDAEAVEDDPTAQAVLIRMDPETARAVANRMLFLLDGPAPTAD